jgi:hypothetical protein
LFLKLRFSFMVGVSSSSWRQLALDQEELLDGLDARKVDVDRDLALDQVLDLGRAAKKA